MATKTEDFDENEIDVERIDDEEEEIEHFIGEE